MPRYKYRCTVCDYEEFHELPMSFDPKVKLSCVECGDDKMTRRISRPSFTMGEGGTLGKWYKNHTGKELFGDK